MQHKPLSNTRVFFGDAESLLIEALAPVAGTPDQFQPIAFRGEQVACVHGVTETLSTILLQNGITLPVALPFKELKRQIYEPDIKSGNHLDLTLVTGQAVATAQAVKLSTQFNPAAGESAKTADNNLRIILFIEDRSGNKITLENLQERHIAYYETSAANSQKTFLKLKNGCYTDAGASDCYVNLPLAQFQEKISSARRDGLETLDLTRETQLAKPKFAGPFL